MLCGWLVSKHQLTYSVVCLSVYPSVCLSVCLSTVFVYSLCLQTVCLPIKSVCSLFASFCLLVHFLNAVRPSTVCLKSVSFSFSIYFLSTVYSLSVYTSSFHYLSVLQSICPLSVGASAVKHWWLFMSRLFVLFRCCCFLISLEHAHTHKPAWTCPQPAARRWPGEWRRHALSCVSREG